MNIIPLTKYEMDCKAQELLRTIHEVVQHPKDPIWGTDKYKHDGSIHISNVSEENEDPDDDEAFSNVRFLDIKFSRLVSVIDRSAIIDVIERFGKTSHHHIRQPRARLIDGSLSCDFNIKYITCKFANTEFRYQLKD